MRIGSSFPRKTTPTDRRTRLRRLQASAGPPPKRLTVLAHVRGARGLLLATADGPKCQIVAWLAALPNWCQVLRRVGRPPWEYSAIRLHLGEAEPPIRRRIDP